MFWARGKALLFPREQASRLSGGPPRQPRQERPWPVRLWMLHHCALLGHWLSHVPDGHDGVDLLLAQRRGDRDAMVAIAHKVDLAELDQLDRRQTDVAQIGPGDAHP